MSPQSRAHVWLMGALMLATGVLATGHVDAQDYPSRPVRVVVPFSPGGAVDGPMRLIAQQLSKRLGQAVFVENKPGAGATIGSELVAKSPPDGYTLLLASQTNAISATLYPNLGFDPIDDFAPISLIGREPGVVVVNPALPVQTLQQLIAYAKARPGQIDYASSGNGSSQHLFGALFMSLADIRMMHIPYKGSAPATTDLIAGQVSVGFPGIALVLPHTKAGRLRALAVTSAERSKAMPDVPSIAEAGVPGYAATLWLGLLAPRGTPPQIVQKLFDEIAKLLRQPEVESAYLATGTDVTISNPEQFGLFVKAEYDKWAKVIKAVDAQVN